MYDLVMIDVTDQVDPSNIARPFGNIDIEKFWDWNHDLMARHGWDSKLDNSPHEKTYEELLLHLQRIVLNKHQAYIEKYGISGSVGPFHYKITKDNEDSYINFGYFIEPGVYESFFHMFIPDKNNKLDWVYTWDHEILIDNFLTKYKKRLRKVWCCSPEKSPMVVHFWKRKAMKSWRKTKNPGDNNSYTYVIDFDFSVVKTEKNMIKTLYVVWRDGWKNKQTPTIVWNSAKSWIARNRDWDVVLLSDENLYHYVSKEFLSKISKFDKKDQYDLIRLELLYRHGGLCVDATTFCLKPVDSWLNQNMLVDDSFFIVPNTMNDAPHIADLSFLYSNTKNNPLYDTSSYIDLENNVHQAFNQRVDPGVFKSFIEKSPGLHRYNKLNGFLSTGVFQLSDQKMASETITPAFLKKQTLKQIPYFQLSLDVTIKNKQHINYTDKNINRLPIAEHYGKNSKLNFINEVLNNELTF
jgi:hypothetical protein